MSEGADLSVGVTQVELCSVSTRKGVCLSSSRELVFVLNFRNRASSALLAVKKREIDIILLISGGGLFTAEMWRGRGRAPISKGSSSWP